MQPCSINTFPEWSHGFLVSLALILTQILVTWPHCDDQVRYHHQRSFRSLPPIVLSWDLRMFILAWLQDSIHEQCTTHMIDQLMTYRAQNLARSQKGPAQTPIRRMSTHVTFTRMGSLCRRPRFLHVSPKLEWLRLVDGPAMPRSLVH